MTDVEDDGRPVGRHAGSFDVRSTLGELPWFSALVRAGPRRFEHPQIGMIGCAGIHEPRVRLPTAQTIPIGLETGDEGRGDGVPVVMTGLHENLVEGDGLVQPAKIIDSIPSGAQRAEGISVFSASTRLLIASVRLRWSRWCSVPGNRR